MSLGVPIPSTGGEAYLTLPHNFSGSPHTINTRIGKPYSAPSYLRETTYHQQGERHTLLCPILSLGVPIPSTRGEAYLTLPHNFSGIPHTINRGRGIPYSAPSFLWESPYHQHEERHTLLCPIISLGYPIPSTGGEAFLTLPHHISGIPPYHQQEERHTLLYPIISLGDPYTINRRRDIS